MHLEKSVVWVTGGASGLGAACVEMASSRGAQVVAFDLSDETPSGLPESVNYVACDVSNHERVAKSTAQAVDLSGSPQVLINCAGIAPASRTVSRKGAHDPELFRKTIEVNLIGTYFMASATAALMSQSTANAAGERGVIINTASVAAFDGQIGQVAYSASKGGIVGMTLPIARDLARSGIRCLTIAPGLFMTPLFQGAPAEVIESLEKQVPFPPRLGKPAEYAHMVQSCLLYTSPSPRDATLSRMPSSA